MKKIILAISVLTISILGMTFTNVFFESDESDDKYIDPPKEKIKQQNELAKQKAKYLISDGELNIKNKNIK